MKQIFGWLVYLFHLLIIAFVCGGIFINLPNIVLLHLVFCASLLLHWYANNNICCLTTLEGYLFNRPYDQGMLHSCIGPMYDIQNREITMIVIGLLLISLFKLIWWCWFTRRYTVYELLVPKQQEFIVETRM